MTVKAQLSDAVRVRAAVVGALPKWVRVSVSEDVFRSEVDVMLDGPAWRRLVAGSAGRAHLTRASAIAAAGEMPVGVALDVRWL